MPNGPEYVTAFPFVVAAIGIVASIFGVMYVKMFASANPQGALMNGTYIAAPVIHRRHLRLRASWWQGFTALARRRRLRPVGSGDRLCLRHRLRRHRRLRQRVLHLVKVQAGARTSPNVARPVPRSRDRRHGRRHAEHLRPVIVLAMAVILAYPLRGVYGVAIAALGMLATTGMVVAVDATAPSPTTRAASPKWRTSTRKCVKSPTTSTPSATPRRPSAKGSPSAPRRLRPSAC
jgi:K(+)-stimulated pyrophosphate-energized sodium pump